MRNDDMKPISKRVLSAKAMNKIRSDTLIFFSKLNSFQLIITSTNHRFVIEANLKSGPLILRDLKPAMFCSTQYSFQDLNLKYTIGFQAI